MPHTVTITISDADMRVLRTMCVLRSMKLAAALAEESDDPRGQTVADDMAAQQDVYERIRVAAIEAMLSATLRK